LRMYFPPSMMRFPLYLTSIGRKKFQEKIVRPEGYPVYHWLQSEEGEGCIIIEGQSIHLGMGDAILISPAVAHRYEPKSTTWTTIWFTFSGYLADSLLGNMFSEGFYLYHLPDNQEFEKRIREMYKFSCDINDHYSTSAAIYAFFMELQKEISDEKTKNPDIRISKVVQYIEQNLGELITLEALAGLLNVTEQHFCRIFKKNMGIRPFQYIQGERIQRAKKLLIDMPGETVQQISLQAGFADTGYFIRKFKEKEGLTPQRFRKYYLEE
jgi:AraC family transcriptional regulator, arabinose operon regulatory protein